QPERIIRDRPTVLDESAANIVVINIFRSHVSARCSQPYLESTVSYIQTQAAWRPELFFTASNRYPMSQRPTPEAMSKPISAWKRSSQPLPHGRRSEKTTSSPRFPSAG